MSATKIVKRYANRKLYDTERSCYVTLDDIALMIRAGDEVRVMDNKSGEDLTSVTLAQIIFETEKKNNFMPLSLLRGLIQEGGDAIGEFTRERVGAVHSKAQEVKETAHKLRTEFGDRMGRIVRKPEDGPATTGEGRASLLSDIVAAPRKALDELQKRLAEDFKSVEERLKAPGGAMARYANLGGEMSEISDRLAALEQRLEEYPQSAASAPEPAVAASSAATPEATADEGEATAGTEATAMPAVEG